LKNRISITGPESTAKTWLSIELAKYYNSCFVEEFSREYLEGKSSYNKEDVLNIARGQLLKENEAAKSCSSLLFCDTDVLVNKIWSIFVFNECDRWMEENFHNHEYGLYLLCYPDIDWAPDPLRENPVDRDVLFEMYENELLKAGFNYKIVRGFDNNRLQNAVNFVDEYLLTNNIENV
jgi:nicotinamide riboside kinase